MANVQQLHETLQREGRVGIRKGKGKTLAIIGAALLFVIVGFFLTLVDPLVGTISWIFGLLGAGAGLYWLLQPKPVIEIDRNGVTQQGYTARWEEIVRFGILDIHGQRFVVLGLSEPAKARLQAEAGTLTKINAGFADGGLCLFNQLEISVEDTLILINRAGEEFMGERARGTF